jgi:hypothetical protein
MRFLQTAIPALLDTAAAILIPPGIFCSVKNIAFNFRSVDKTGRPTEYIASKSLRLFILSPDERLYFLPMPIIHHSLLISCGRGLFCVQALFFRLQNSFSHGNHVCSFFSGCWAGMFFSLIILSQKDFKNNYTDCYKQGNFPYYITFTKNLFQ